MSTIIPCKIRNENLFFKCKEFLQKALAISDQCVEWK